MTACGDDDRTIGGTPDACVGCPDAPPAPDAQVFDAMEHPDAQNDPGGPDNVQVIDPTDDQLLSGDTMDLRCQAMPDATSSSPIVLVTFDVDDENGTRVSAVGSSSAPDQWSAVANVSNLANGPLTVTCTATGMDDLAASDTNVAKLDLGPDISILSPSAGQAVHGQISVDFIVTPDPIDAADTMAGIDVPSVRAVIKGIDITSRLTSTPGAGGSVHFSGDVQANDPTLFSPALEGDNTLRVEASNQRGIQRVARQIFNVDNNPPTITFISPMAGDLVGGIITVRATIVDPHGVDPATITAVFGNGSTTIASFPLEHAMGDEYVGSYDSRDLRAEVVALYGVCGTDCAATPSCPAGQDCFQLVFPTLSVRASDLAGNEGAAGEVVTMDYTPPVASLDPPELREARFSAASGALECSYAFDPLGDDATNDEQAVGQFSEYRARIEDQPNGGLFTSSIVVPAAGVDGTRVQLFVLDDTTENAMGTGEALVVDTNGDGIADEINPLVNPDVTPSIGDAVVIDLTGIDSAGTSLFGPSGATDPDPLGVAPFWPACNYSPPPGPDPAPARCQPTSGLQRVIKPEIGLGQVIFGIPPIAPVQCLGFPFDAIGNSVADGWACVAVRAVDMLGNVGVSRPIRVCFDSNGDGVEGCPNLPSYYPVLDTTYDPADDPVVPTGIAPIDCMGTYDPTTGVVDASPTQPVLPPLDFPQYEMRRSDL